MGDGFQHCYFLKVSQMIQMRSQDDGHCSGPVVPKEWFPDKQHQHDQGLITNVNS